jgi:hypothetical protein
VLAFGARVERGTALTDCVIGDGETVPAGTRLDEVRQPAP